MASDMSSYQTVEEAAYAQDQTEGPVTLLATSNGTHIAVQVTMATDDTNTDQLDATAVHTLHCP